jgi:hypothetical protein
VVVAIFVGFEFGDSGVAFATHFAVEVAAQLAGAFGLGCGLGWVDGCERWTRWCTCALGRAVERCEHVSYLIRYATDMEHTGPMMDDWCACCGRWKRIVLQEPKLNVAKPRPG